MVEEVCDDKEFVDTLKDRLSRRRIVKTLAALRAARGLSQGDVAKKLRCTQSRISKLENGYDDELRVGELKDYAEGLGLELQLALLPK
jgi:transcriptional regulator with XRE-family HTH domain